MSSRDPDSSPILTIEASISRNISHSLIGSLKPSPLTTLSVISKISPSAILFPKTPATIGSACTKETPDDNKVDKVLVNLKTIIFCLNYL